MSELRLLVRGALLIAHLLFGMLLCALMKLNVGGWLAPEPLTQFWNRHLLKILGLRITRRGQAVAGARITVANHVSWLDIPLLAASEPTRFIAKSEIRHWPVAGWLANAAGSFYIRRGRGGARPLLERLTPHLRNGGAVTLFPEGTTTNGRQVLGFHARLFASALEAGCWVQPVALRYGRGDDGSDVAPFIGDDDLFSHILRVLREPQMQVQILYCTPIKAVGLDRDELAQRAQAAVSRALGFATPELETRMEPALAA